MQNKWQKQAKEYLEGWKRSKADFVNLKKRIEKDRNELRQNARKDAILQVLPILDGMEILVREFKRVLGIKPVPTKKFDPSMHEAIGGSGEIIEKVVQQGYFLQSNNNDKNNDKQVLIRPAKVQLKK